MPAPGSFCPYVGLVPYGERDRDYFFGRERDERVISSNLFAAPLTVFYGASGVGKSSVLLAGVVPKLRATQRTAVVVFNEWHGATFLDKLKKDCLGAVQAVCKMPVAIDPNLPLDELLSAAAKPLGGPILILFDQFEEYFLYHPESHSADSFEAQLARAVNREEVDANFLISLREDGFSKLDRFRARISNLLGNTLRLQHLDTASAGEAIRRPLEVFNRRFSPPGGPMTIEDELVREVLHQVRTGQVVVGESCGAGQTGAQADGDQIEAPFLQLVMTRLWKAESEAGSNTLRLATLVRLGGAEQIIKTHLDDVMEKFSGAEREYAARIFHFLVTPKGAKIAHSTEDLLSFAEGPGDVVTHLLQRLQGERILRPVSVPKGYEIFHDVLAPAILDWRARYLRAAQQEEIRQKAEREAEEREREAARERQLEQTQALAQAERRRAEELSRAAGRLRRALIALGLIFLFFIGSAEYTRRLSNEAARIREQLQHLNVEQSKAEQERERKAREESEKKRTEAEKDARDHESLRRRAEQHARIAFSRQLAAMADDKLGIDPELSVLLARQAVLATYPTDGEPTREAESALHQAVQASRIRNTYALATADVLEATFSSDGRRLATSGFDGTIEIWDTASGSSLHTLIGQARTVTSLAFSPKDPILASGSEDQTIVLWDLRTGQHLAEPLEGHTSKVRSLAFSPDGRILASGGCPRAGRGGCTPGEVRLWSVAERTPLGPPLTGHKSVVLSLSFHPDGKTLVSGDADGNVLQWEVATQQARGQPLKAHDRRVNALAFSPDGRRAASASADGTVKRWDSTFSRLSFSLNAHRGEANYITFSPDGTRFASAGEDRLARVWDVSTGRDLFTLASHTDRVIGIAFSTKGLVTVSQDETVKLWDVSPARELLTLAGHEDEVIKIDFSPDGKRLATASFDQTAKVWDIPSGRLLLSLIGHTGQVAGVAFSPDGRRIATASLDETAKVWDAVSGKLLLTLAGHSDGVYDIAFSPDGQRLATGGLDGTARIWDARSGRELRTLTTNEGEEIAGIAFSPDGRRLATAHQDETARIWDTVSGKELRILKGHGDRVWDVAFSPDGKRLATASFDRTARVWDASSGELLLTLIGHTDQLWGVTFSPDGKRLATASSDRTAKVWDADSGEERLTLAGHLDAVTRVAFSPDGKFLATSSEDGTVQVYAGNVPELMALARARTTRSIRSEECQKFHLALKECEAARLAQAGKDLAKAMDVKGAVTTFRKALLLDPTLNIAPEENAGEIAARAQVDRGRELAKRGDLEGALKSFGMARGLDPTLRLNADREARRFVAESLVAKGRDLARRRNVEGAVANFRRAQQLDPSLRLDPQAEAETWSYTGVEASAVGSLRTVNTAAREYAKTYGSFPPSLASLGPSEGAASATAANLLDEELAGGSKRGYFFLYTAMDTNGDGRMDAYTIQADPISPGKSEQWHYFTDQTGVIRARTGMKASVTDPPIARAPALKR